MPMVVIKDGVKLFSENCSRQQDLPTPESPIKRSFICVSRVSTAAGHVLKRQGTSVGACTGVEVLNVPENRNFVLLTFSMCLWLEVTADGRLICARYRRLASIGGRAVGILEGHRSS